MTTFEEKSGLNFGKIIKAFLISIAVTAALFLILGLILYTTGLSDAHISKIVFIISILALIVGGYISADGAEKSGFLCGGLAALPYCLIIIIGSIILNKGFPLNIKFISSIIAYIASGMFGGSLGINRKKKKSGRFRYTKIGK